MAHARNQVGLARTYARAFFDVAKSGPARDEWVGQVGTIAHSLDSDSARGFFESPLVNSETKRETIEEVLKKVNASEEVSNLYRILNENGRISLAPRIREELEQLLLREKGISRARVVSARPLSRDLEKQLHAYLEVRFASKIEMTTKQDPGLLGGFTARVGNTLLEASLRKRLGDLKQDLVAN